MVRGQLKFVKPGPMLGGTRVKIRVEDTSRAGASAREVASAMVEIPEDFDLEADTLPFRIDLDRKAEGLTISAHMPCHAGDDIRGGDMITTESIPASDVEETEVPLHRV